jgi:hypothetical protein
MMPAKLILLTAFVCLLVIVAFLWPEEKSSLDFVGYKWNPTNHMWYAELSFVNRSRKAIKYEITDGRQTGFFYEFKETNDLKDGWSMLEERMTVHEVGPKQRVTFRAPLDLTKVSLININHEIESLADIEILHVVAGIPLRIGVAWPMENNNPSVVRDGIFKMGKALKMQPSAKRIFESDLVWCPEVLLPPPKVKP